jgi:hypothetical protein
MSTSPAWLDDAQKVTGAARQQRRRDGRRVFLVMMDDRICLMMTEKICKAHDQGMEISRIISPLTIGQTQYNR